MKIGSLFSGLGGLELGLEWSGLGETIWHVEQSEYCRSVLKRQWPNAATFVDVRGVGAHNLEAVDLVAGGFPCQDISGAGSGKGLAGERSGLWVEFARIVDELRPSWVVVENVSSGSSRWIDPVSAALERQGYETLPIPISARLVGAPHLRRRIFVVAYAERQPLRNGPERKPGRPSIGVQGQGHAEPSYDGEPRATADAGGERLQGRQRLGEDGQQKQPAAPRGCEALADADEGRRQGERLKTETGLEGKSRREPDRRHSARPELARAQGSPAECWTPQPPVCPVVNGVSSRLAKQQIEALGNAVVPQCAEVVGHVILELERMRRESKS